MDGGGRGGKGKGGKGGAKKAARARAGSTSSSSGNTSTASKGKTPTTASLEEEATRVAAMAAAADAKAKAHQRKMTEFVQGQGRAAQGGAGELVSGPSGPCAAAAPVAHGQGQGQGQSQAHAAPPDGAGELASGPSGPAAAGTPKHVQFQTKATVHQGPQGQAAALQGGAGELPPGPSGPAAPTAATIQDQLRQYREQAGGDEEISIVGQVPAPQGPQGRDQEEEGGWQTFVSRKNRRIGERSDDHQREAREPTPFRIPGIQSSTSRGYYTSAYERNRVRMDQGRSSKPSVVAALTPRQWEWYKQRLCLACGQDHQVKDCRMVTRQQGFALVRATRDCPQDMRPLPLPNRDQARGRRDRRDQGDRASTAAEAPAAVPTAAAAAATPARTAATKRPRETGGGAGPSSGLTPEAKKAKQFSEAAKEGLTLYVREKDGSALTEERYNSLKTSFAYYVEDMMANNKDPPICGGRWTHSRSVVKIPMMGEIDLLFMRCFLDKSYLVQSGEEYNKSKGQVFVAFLRDRLEPELTGMRPEKLASFIKYYKRSAKIDGLFELKMAFKTPRGKAVHLVMDDKAAEAFIAAGQQIPFAGAGYIHFEERSIYIARIRDQERARQQPKKSVLEQGLREQQMDMSKMSVDESSDKGEAGKQEEENLEPEKEKVSEETVRRAKELREKVKEGSMNTLSAYETFLEETGKDLDEIAPLNRRTTSGSSWSEEMDHAKSLVVPETVEEEPGEAGGAEKADDEQDFAMFELFDSRAEGSGSNPEGHRAAGPADPAQGAH